MIPIYANESRNLHHQSQLRVHLLSFLLHRHDRTRTELFSETQGMLQTRMTTLSWVGPLLDRMLICPTNKRRKVQLVINIPLVISSTLHHLYRPSILRATLQLQHIPPTALLLRHLRPCISINMIIANTRSLTTGVHQQATTAINSLSSTLLIHTRMLLTDPITIASTADEVPLTITIPPAKPRFTSCKTKTTMPSRRIFAISITRTTKAISCSLARPPWTTISRQSEQHQASGILPSILRGRPDEPTL